jgi:anti-sigma B factor antagonist
MPELVCRPTCTLIEIGEVYDSLDLDALNEIGGKLLTQARDADPPRLILDMSQTNLIGSTFIELLVRTWKRLCERGGVMALCGLQPFCADVLRVTRLETLWQCYSTREDALRAMTERSKA